VLEEASRNTRVKVTNVLPSIDTADQIKIVSDPMHALNLTVNPWWPRSGGVVRG
jgi:hypothetical protein